MGTDLPNRSFVIIPPPPPRFSLNEWHLNNYHRYRNTEDQQQLADRILLEAERVRDLSKENATLNRNETNHHLEQKIEDINFRKQEILKQRKEVCLEIEALETYKERILDALKVLKEQGSTRVKKCIILREGRLGIDLCHDDVERELLKEVEIVGASQALLDRTCEQTDEEIRRLRSAIYFMDRDLEDKDNALKIDRINVSLKDTSLNLSMYHGHAPLDSATITEDEWDQFTLQNIQAAAKEINSARLLRSYVDTLLKQVIEDLRNQCNIVNEAFRRRIEETKQAKTKLEIQHSENVRQVNEMLRTITELEKSLAEKEGFMALAHTRLGNRAQRPGVECCRDSVNMTLVNEVKTLTENVADLQQMMAEAQASLRYLLKSQIQLEEDINVKANTLKIDEVDCMTIRQGIDYHAY